MIIDTKDLETGIYLVENGTVYRLNLPITKVPYALKEAPVCPFCGGKLSETRYHDGNPYKHCYSCHFDHYEVNDGGE